MPAKKKKGKKGGKKKTTEGEKETKNENEELKVSLPTFGWIKITLKLCAAPTPEYNWFDFYMLTSQSVMMV